MLNEKKKVCRDAFEVHTQASLTKKEERKGYTWMDDPRAAGKFGTTSDYKGCKLHRSHFCAVMFHRGSKFQLMMCYSGPNAAPLVISLNFYILCLGGFVKLNEKQRRLSFCRFN